MAIKRVMGLETEYGINGDPRRVLMNYRGKEVWNGGGGYGDHGMSIVPIARGTLDSQRTGLDPRLMQVLIDFDVPEASSSSQTSHCTTVQDADSTSKIDDKMLANGARLYIDMGHPEYSTPECSNPLDVVIADKAGERILRKASRNGKTARIFKDNTDRHELCSHGTHENYLIKRPSERRFRELADFITAFLVTRIIYTGNGKISPIGGYERARNLKLAQTMVQACSYLGSVLDEHMQEVYKQAQAGLEEIAQSLKEQEVTFQISQKASFIEREMGHSTIHNRAIVNTRDEPLADEEEYMRLHITCGDANMSEIAGFLKLGTTGLVLDLFEDNALEPVILRHPVRALHQISRDLKCIEKYQTLDNGMMTAIEIQRYYLEAAEKAYRERDRTTNEVLDRWRFVLDGLGGDAGKLETLDRWLDWKIKKKLIDLYTDEKEVGLEDGRVRDLDVQYHELGGKGLFDGLQRRKLVDRLLTDEQIECAVENPPKNTRAWIRGELIRRDLVFKCDWHRISLREHSGISIVLDPLQATAQEIGDLDGDLPGLLRLLAEKGYIRKR
jgi:proteasome accessory factor A